MHDMVARRLQSASHALDWTLRPSTIACASARQSVHKHSLRLAPMAPELSMSIGSNVESQYPKLDRVALPSFVKVAVS
jgi:hypothetical protein